VFLVVVFPAICFWLPGKEVVGPFPRTPKGQEVSIELVNTLFHLW